MSTPAGDDGLVGDATIRVDGDTDPATRALARFSRDAQGRLRDVRGRFVSETQIINRTVTNNTPTLTVNTTPATTAINNFTRDANGRLRDVNGRFVRTGDSITRSLTTAAGGGDRFSFSLRGIANAAQSAAGILGRVGIGVAAIGAAAGTTAPLLAGIVTTLENVAPAGAVAVTGMLAITQAQAAVRLGMVGIEDAVTAAFDTSEAGAKKFDEALKKLAPNARAFAVQVKELQPAFQRFQQGIQNRLFAGFADELERLSSSVLPTVRTNLNATADTLNRMALGAASAARGLATSGALGKAMAGANAGLSNLQRIPGQVVTALGQLAVAGAPAFDRLTAGAAGFATSISEKLNSAFESGALTEAVNTAVGVLKDLGSVAANVFGILRNVMAPVQAAGGGLVGTLKEITGALREATATEGFQSAISAVSQVMATLARTAGPLLGQALGAIGPVLTALQGPAQTLIESLGAGLSPIIVGLGPVLESAAVAVGVLVEAASPLLPVVGQLAASLLPALIPILDAAQTVFAALAPVVQTVSQTLQSTLQPVLAQLPGAIAPLAKMLAGQLVMGIQLLGGLLVKLAPSFVSLGQSAGQLLAAAAPLITIVAGLTTQLQGALLPAIQPIINVVAALASALAGQLASTLTNLVVPALRLITDLLRGDFSAAWNSLKALVSGVVAHFTGTLSRIGSVVGSIVQGIVDRFVWLYNILIGNSIIPELIMGIIGWFTRLPGMAFSALASFAGGIARIATTALSRFRSAIVSGANTAIGFVRGIPGRARAALAALGGMIANVATSALSRFRSAISTGASNAISVVRGIPGRVRGALGGIGSLLAGAGADLMRGMIGGIQSMAGALASTAKNVVGGAVSAAKSALGISSPSKVFAAIGRDTGRGFIKGLTGTRDKIRQTTESIAASITKAFRGRNTRVDDRLVSMLERGNVRLQKLAAQRDKIADQLKKAQEFAASTTQSALSFASLGGGLGGEGPTLQSVQGDLQKRLNQIKSFTANIKKLAGLGLRKDLLQQIIELGPEQGAAYAAALSQGGKAGIKEINKIQGQIAGAAKSLGRISADRLFDSGKNAGRGFLEGLKGQRKSIERLMLDIAKGMQRAIRRALGIKSPSTVMAQVGRQTLLGLQAGIARTAPLAAQAMARVADAVASAAPTTLPFTTDRVQPTDLGVTAMRAATTGAPVTVVNHYHFQNHGVIGSPIELQNWLARTLDTLAQQRRLPASLRRAVA
jgi:phage-related protein